MNTDNPWFDSRTAKDFILERNTVTEITRENIAELIGEAEKAIRYKDINSLMALIALDFEYISYEYLYGELKRTKGDRGRFQIGMCGTMDAQNNTDYSMEIKNIEIESSNFANVSLVVRNHEDKELQNIMGDEINEAIEVSLYKGRPVISRLEVETWPNKTLQSDA